MAVEIVPEPSEAERTAIEAALAARDPVLPAAYLSAWRRSGIDDAAARAEEPSGTDFVTNPSN